MVVIASTCELIVDTTTTSNYRSIGFLCPSKAPVNSEALHSLPVEFLVGTAMTLFGGALRLWCFHTMGHNFTFEITIRSEHRLIVNGPYKYCRHPSYLGGFIQIIGFIMMHLAKGGWNRECEIMATKAGWIVNLFFAIAIFSFWSWEKRARFEDNLLRQKFGIEWDTYNNAVPYRFVPLIW